MELYIIIYHVHVRLVCIGRIYVVLLYSLKKGTTSLHKNSLDRGFGTQDYVWHLRGLQNHMQVFSLNLGTVYVNTSKREFACQPMMVS